MTNTPECSCSCSCELMHQLDIRLQFGESDCLTLECNLPLIDFYVTRQLLQVLKGHPDPRGAFISNTSDIFWASRGSWFPTVWAVPSAKICRWSHLPRTVFSTAPHKLQSAEGVNYFPAHMLQKLNWTASKSLFPQRDSSTLEARRYGNGVFHSPANHKPNNSSNGS